MHTDIDALEIVCQHYRSHYEQAELRRLKNMARRLRNDIIRLQCEVGILRSLLRAWVRASLRSTLSSNFELRTWG